MPMLENVMKRYSGMSTDVTGAQTAGINNMRSTLAGMPDFSSQITGGMNSLFNSDTQPQQDMWSSAYKDLQSNLGGVARGDFLDPMNQPGMSGWLDTLGSDITDRVKGVYAGSGRAPSGAGSFAGSLGRGLMEGQAPVVANQANVLRNNQMDAAKTLFGGGGSTAQGTAGLGQMDRDNIMKAMGITGSLPGLYGAKDSAMMNLANTEAGLPWANLERLLNPTLGIASLGQESSGTGTRTQPQSTMSNIIGGTTAAASLLPMFFSDERLKDDIHPIGILDDGVTNVYSYKYKGDPRPRIGLIAQEVEKTRPDAVAEIAGFKALDYGKATENARFMRGLLDMEAA